MYFVLFVDMLICIINFFIRKRCRRRLVIAQTSLKKKQALLMTKLSPEHGDNKIDQQEIGEQHIYSCYSLNRPILL